MRPRYVSSDIVRVPGTRIRYTRTSDRKRHYVTVSYTTPRAPIDRETLRANTWRNDGFRAHSDTVARMYV